MKRDIKVSSLIFFFIQFILSVYFAYSFFTFSYWERLFFLIDKWGLLSFLLLVWGIFTWYNSTGKILSFYSVFYFTAIIFHFGQAWVNSLSSNNSVYVQVSQFYNSGAINYAYFYSFCCLMMLHLGALLVSLIYFPKRPDIKKVKKEINLEVLKTFGIYLFIISLITIILIDYNLFQFARTGGYLATYKFISTNLFWQIVYRISFFFYPSIYILLFCYKENSKKWNTLFMFTILYNLAYAFFIGNRGTVFLSIISLFLFRHLVFKKFTKKDIIKLSVLSLALLVFSSFIALTRYMAREDLNITNMLDVIKGYNLFYSAIAEFGGTIMTLLVGIRYIPTAIPFGNGISYLATIMTAIPDFGLFNTIKEYTSVSEILNDYHVGLGGSFITEMYYNFGNYGIIFAIIVGILIGLFLKKLDFKNIKENNSTSAIWMTLIYMSILVFARDQFYSISIGFIYYFAYPYILYWLYKNLVRG